MPDESSARKERLEARLAGLRTSSDQKAMRRRASHWPLYAAVTGSALAMSQNATVPDLPSQNAPLIQAVILKTPGISSGGIVPVYSTRGMIQPGEWVSIYGTSLASGTAVWKGDFPTSLGGTSVTINGKAAYLSMVSPKQINLQAPDDPTVGQVNVVVTSSGGQAKAQVFLNPISPSFLLRDARHVSGIIVRTNGSGAFGKGTYDILGPTGNCFGFASVGASAGDLVELFSVGFGPTTPSVPAGKVFSGSAPITEKFALFINDVPITPTFVGISSAGLYQINFVVPPGLGQGDVPIQAFVGAYPTQDHLLFSLQGSLASEVCVLPTSGGDGSSGGDGGDGSSGGDGGSGDGGSGDGGSGDGGDGGGSGDGGGDGGDGG